jgi:hypothetical protein
MALRFLIALTSVLGIISTAGIAWYLKGMSGFGMGHATSPIGQLSSLVPFLYFSFCLLSTLPVLGRYLKIGGIVAHSLVLPIVAIGFMNGLAGSIASMVILGFVGLWYAMYRQRIASAVLAGDPEAEQFSVDRPWIVLPAATGTTIIALWIPLFLVQVFARGEIIVSFSGFAAWLVGVFTTVLLLRRRQYFWAPAPMILLLCAALLFEFNLHFGN